MMSKPYSFVGLSEEPPCLFVMPQPILVTQVGADLSPFAPFEQS